MSGLNLDSAKQISCKAPAKKVTVLLRATGNKTPCTTNTHNCCTGLILFLTIQTKADRHGIHSETLFDTF